MPAPADHRTRSKDVNSPLISPGAPSDTANCRFTYPRSMCSRQEGSSDRKPTCESLSVMGRGPTVWSSVCLKLPQGRGPTGPTMASVWGSLLSSLTCPHLPFSLTSHKLGELWPWHGCGFSPPSNACPCHRVQPLPAAAQPTPQHQRLWDLDSPKIFSWLSSKATHPPPLQTLFAPDNNH